MYLHFSGYKKLDYVKIVPEYILDYRYACTNVCSIFNQRTLYIVQHTLLDTTFYLICSNVYISLIV